MSVVRGLGALIALLKDEDRALRMKCLEVLANYQGERSVREALTAVAESGDPFIDRHLLSHLLFL